MIDFEAKARGLLMRMDVGDRDPVELVAAALREVHDAALAEAKTAVRNFASPEDGGSFRSVVYAAANRINALNSGAKR